MHREAGTPRGERPHEPRNRRRVALVYRVHRDVGHDEDREVPHKAHAAVDTAHGLVANASFDGCGFGDVGGGHGRFLSSCVSLNTVTSNDVDMTVKAPV